MVWKRLEMREVVAVVYTVVSCDCGWRVAGLDRKLLVIAMRNFVDDDHSTGRATG